MSAQFPRLFTPARIGRHSLRNRVVFGAHTANMAENGLPGAAHVAYYEARARGGVGMIVSEGLRVHSTNCNPTSIGTFVPEVVTGLSRIAERVHAHGVTLIGQIMHGGRQSHQHVPHLLWAPSAVPCLYSGYVPHAMTTAEVEEMREHFVLAAIRVQDAGWDGVELHAAQGLPELALIRRRYGKNSIELLGDLVGASAGDQIQQAITVFGGNDDGRR